MNLLKDKRGLELKLGLYALVVVSMAVIATGVWIDDWNDKYNSGLTYDLDSDYNKLDTLSDEVESQRESISVKSSAQSESDFEGTTLRAAFGILNNIFTPFDALFGNGGMLDSVTERFGLPDYVRQGFITIILFSLVFALIAIFFGRRNT